MAEAAKGTAAGAPEVGDGLASAAAKTAEASPLERERWASKIEFVLACIGLSVGLGNIWRFPYVVYENGGAAFLIPYIIIVAAIGRPMYYMELVMGQFSSSGSVKVFDAVPLARGVGMCMPYVCFGISLYYNVILAYALLYMYYSCFRVLPWTTCDPAWADENCYERGENTTWTCQRVKNELFILYEKNNSTDIDAVPVKVKDKVVMVPEQVFADHMLNCTNATHTATEQFFWKNVVNLGTGIEDLGPVQTKLFACLLVAWVCIFFCVFKGIKSSGKVVMVSAVAPFFILGAFLIRGVTLEGATKGLEYYFVPDWSKVMRFEVWQQAAQQVFFSLSVSQGVVICIGGYNDFRNTLYQDVYLIALADLMVSFVAGIVVFSVLGNLATNLGVEVQDVVAGGFGLAFIAYPEAVTHISLPNVWSLAFFLMLFFLALDSEFALVEGVLTPLKDAFPALQGRLTLLAFAICLVEFLLGISMTTRGGMYIINLLDTLIGDKMLFLIAVFESISVALLYGVNRLSLDIEFMLGRVSGMAVKFCLQFVCPIVLSTILVTEFFTYKPLTFAEYVYPKWAQAVSLMLVLVPFLMMVAVAIRHFYRCGLSCSNAVKPALQWGPKDPGLRREYENFLAARNYPTVSPEELKEVLAELEALAPKPEAAAGDGAPHPAPPEAGEGEKAE